MEKTKLSVPIVEEDDRMPEIAWNLSIEPISELPRRPAKPEFSKTAIPKYVVSPPWQPSRHEVPKFATGENSPVTQATSIPSDSEAVLQKNRLYFRKISALMKGGRLPVTEICSPRKNPDESSLRSPRKDRPIKMKQPIRLGKGKIKLTSCGSSTRSTFTLKYANKKSNKFEDSVTDVNADSECVSPSINCSESLSQRSKGPAAASSVSRSPLSSASSFASNSSTGLTWNRERKNSRDSNPSSIASSSSNLSDFVNCNSNAQSTLNDGFSRMSRDKAWYRLHYPLSLRLPEGVTSNISIHSCDGSRKTNTAKLRPEKPIDLALSWKQSASGSHVFASGYESKSSKKETDTDSGGRDSSSSSFASKDSTSNSVQTALSPRKSKSDQKNCNVATSLSNTGKLAKKSKRTKKIAAFVTKGTTKKNSSRKISPRPGNDGGMLDLMASKQAPQFPLPVDWSSNLMAIRQLEIFALARAERERFNFTEYAKWTLLVVFICFVLFYRSEIGRPCPRPTDSAF